VIPKLSRVYVPLERDQIDALLNVSDRRARDPRTQARLFILEGLRRAGALNNRDLNIAVETARESRE
jgi:hypothetical protein